MKNMNPCGCCVPCLRFLRKRRAKEENGSREIGPGLRDVDISLETPAVQDVQNQTQNSTFINKNDDLRIPRNTKARSKTKREGKLETIVKHRTSRPVGEKSLNVKLKEVEMLPGGASTGETKVNKGNSTCIPVDEKYVTAWMEIEDVRTGKSYYYNNITKESVWQKPPAFDSLSFIAAKLDKEKGNVNWIEAFDKGGRRYYYDEFTGKARWDRPACFSTATTRNIKILERRPFQTTATKVNPKVIKEIDNTSKHSASDVTHSGKVKNTDKCQEDKKEKLRKEMTSTDISHDISYPYSFKKWLNSTHYRNHLEEKNQSLESAEELEELEEQISKEDKIYRHIKSVFMRRTSQMTSEQLGPALLSDDSKQDTNDNDQNETSEESSTNSSARKFCDSCPTCY